MSTYYRPRHARTRPAWRLALFILAAGLLVGAASSAALLAANPGGFVR
jgi:anti-sigma factor RsiW